MNAVTGATDADTLDVRLHRLRDTHRDVGKILIYLVSSTLFDLPRPLVGRYRAAFLSVNDEDDLTMHIPVIDQLVRYGCCP